MEPIMGFLFPLYAMYYFFAQFFAQNYIYLMWCYEIEFSNLIWLAPFKPNIFVTNKIHSPVLDCIHKSNFNMNISRAQVLHLVYSITLYTQLYCWATPKLYLKRINRPKFFKYLIWSKFCWKIYLQQSNIETNK